jgi:hypothetical protein
MAPASAVKSSSNNNSSSWLAANPSKRWAELFYLAYSPFWILWALCVLVPFQLYEVGSWQQTCFSRCNSKRRQYLRLTGNSVVCNCCFVVHLLVYSTMHGKQWTCCCSCPMQQQPPPANASTQLSHHQHCHAAPVDAANKQPDDIILAAVADCCSTWMNGATFLWAWQQQCRASYCPSCYPAR